MSVTIANPPPARIAGTPLLLCGHPRSGTSLLLSLLDWHREVLAYPHETKYFRAIHGRPGLRDADTLLSQTRIGRMTHDRTTALEQGRDLSAVDEGTFTRVLREQLNGEATQADVLPAVMLAYAASIQSEPRRYWVEKTPIHELDLDTALELWPDTRAIYIVRDPRDVYTSFRKKRKARGKGLSVMKFAIRIRRSLASWRRFAEAHPERGQLLRYEDLTRKPEASMRAVAKFLGIEWTDELLQPTLVGLPWGGNSMFAETHREVSAAPIGRFAKALTPIEVRALERLLSEMFDRFGWPRTSAIGGFGDWLAVARCGALGGRERGSRQAPSRSGPRPILQIKSNKAGSSIRRHPTQTALDRPRAARPMLTPARHGAVSTRFKST